MVGDCEWLTNCEKHSIGNWTVTIQKFTFRLRFQSLDPLNRPLIKSFKGSIFQSIILNSEQPNGYFLNYFMTLTCCEKKLKCLEKCLCLGLQESWSHLELKFKRLGLVSEKCGKVLVSVFSQIKKQMSRSHLGLGPEGLVYSPATQLHVGEEGEGWAKKGGTIIPVYNWHTNSKGLKKKTKRCLNFEWCVQVHHKKIKKMQKKQDIRFESLQLLSAKPWKIAHFTVFP